MKKVTFLLLFGGSILLSKPASAQIDTPIEHFQTQPPLPPPPKVYEMFQVKGKVIGVNLEDVKDVTVINIRTAERVNSDARGLFRLSVAKGDTVTFQVSRYSKEMRIIKRPGENLDVILIKRTADSLPANRSASDYNKARKADEELYRILAKDAKLEGKWAY